MSVRFGILGPLQVHEGGVAVEIPGVKTRVLLAALIVHAGYAVAAGALAEIIWTGHRRTGRRPRCEATRWRGRVSARRALLASAPPRRC